MIDDHNARTHLPVACTLTHGEFVAMRDGLLPGLVSKAESRESIPEGFRWRFSPEAGLLKEVAAVIDAEHQCCTFLRFVLRVDASEGAVCLEVDGPAGTADFLTMLVDTPADTGGG